MKKFFWLVFFIQPFLSCSQTSLNTYCSKTEQNDAAKLADIETAVFNKTVSYDSLELKLNKIISHVPTDYVNEFNFNGKKYIKFWSEMEQNTYLEKVKKPVEYLQNVYPYACYLLAVIKIEQGDLNKAGEILDKGLALESNQPNLLNEYGFLHTQIGITNKDTNSFHTAISYYKKTITTRLYSTNQQKATALRGIGYNLFELKNYEKSKEFYLASLSLEESDVARNEIVLINNILSGDSQKVYYNGSNIDKEKAFTSLEYLTSVEEKLPKRISDSMPDGYVYIWSKASIYLIQGSQVFREEDYFNYPKLEWNIDQVDAGTHQIVHYLKGITSDHYIETLNNETAEQLLLTYHFKKINSRKLSADIYKIQFEHVMDGRKIALFFKFRNK